jgi:hypothetical protein
MKIKIRFKDGQYPYDEPVSLNVSMKVDFNDRSQIVFIVKNVNGSIIAEERNLKRCIN